MSTYTRDNILSIVKGHLIVEELSLNNEDRVRNAVNAIMTDLVEQGLIYTENKKTHISGRAQQEYHASNLYPRLYNYVKYLRKNSLMWAVGHAMIDHLEFLGYNISDVGIVEHNPTKKERALREFIFGKEKADEYYKSKEETNE